MNTLSRNEERSWATRRSALLLSLCLSGFACGDETGGTQNQTKASSASSTGVGGAASSSGSAGGGGAAATCDDHSGLSQPRPLGEVGTLVSLGDSLSSDGDQPPWPAQLIELLRARDAEVEYYPLAAGGTTVRQIIQQIEGLPTPLRGPVAITVTGGGADLLEHFPAAIRGEDQAIRLQLQKDIDTVIATVLEPDRFGPGVEVRVYWTNIYDPTDGKGDFSNYIECFVWAAPPPYPPSDPYFCAWNRAIADGVLGRSQVLVDIHSAFYGHGFVKESTWYAKDCIHPGVLGHREMSRMFYEAIVGEPAP